MIAASIPVHRPAGAKLLVVDRGGHMSHRPRSVFAFLLHPGDVVIANDAATLPASLSGVHKPSGRRIEVRLAGCDTLAFEATEFSAVVFGEGDFRMRTEDRPKPPMLDCGDRLELGPLRARVVRLKHPRLIALEFEGSRREIWEGLARYGRPIQYAHVPVPLAPWDTWTSIAGPPVAFEAPSAGFVLDWSMLDSMTERGILFGTITHAAGISSTGDAELDALLPLDEPYRIPQSTARMVNEARGRIIAIGTTVVRALEHAAACDGVVRAGDGVATQRVGPSSRLRVVDAIVSGTHEPGTSHYDLLRAFAEERTLRRMDEELNRYGYRTHEFGDSIFLEKGDGLLRPGPPEGRPTRPKRLRRAGCMGEDLERASLLIAGHPLPDGRGSEGTLQKGPETCEVLATGGSLSGPGVRPTIVEQTGLESRGSVTSALRMRNHL